VVIVNPGGTGAPMRVISPRLAPFPPNKARTASHSPPTAFWAFSTSLNKYTHCLDIKKNLHEVLAPFIKKKDVSYKFSTVNYTPKKGGNLGNREENFPLMNTDVCKNHKSFGKNA
jgi:hypothetical protein